MRGIAGHEDALTLQFCDQPLHPGLGHQAAQALELRCHRLRAAQILEDARRIRARADPNRAVERQWIRRTSSPPRGVTEFWEEDFSW